MESDRRSNCYFSLLLVLTAALFVGYLVLYAFAALRIELTDSAGP